MPKKIAVVVYPFLASAFPVLTLAANNVGELVEPSDPLVPVGMSLLVALAAWLAAGLVAGDPHKRALLTLLVVVAFASYGHATEACGAVDPPLPCARDNVTLPLFALVLGGLSALVLRAKRDFTGLSRYLNLATGFLLAFPVVGFARAATLHDAAARGLSPGDLPRARGGAGQRRPDIFLIILDKYSGSRSLSERYAFDNTAFERHLSSRGFFVPATPHSNYVFTFLSLSSLLNWRYLDDLPRRFGRGNGVWSLAYPLVEDNRTWRFLKAQGYRFVFLRTGLGVSAQNRFADVQLPARRRVRRELEVVWWNTTPLPPMVGAACRVLGCKAKWFGRASAETPDLMDWKFRQLATLGGGAHPTFVFAHLMVPHEPFIYHADCSHREPYWPKRYQGAAGAEARAAYVEQIRCVNKKVSTLVDQLLARPGNPPIIILQSDHGNGRFVKTLPPLREAEPDQVRERSDIFAAYFFPGWRGAPVYDSITPVNVLRLALSHYFGADLPRLGDATFWSSTDHPYEFARVR